MAAAVNRKGDAKPLAEFLQTIAPPQVRPILDDLFRRYELRLVRKPGGVAPPAYEFDQCNLLDAVQFGQESGSPTSAARKADA